MKFVCPACEKTIFNRRLKQCEFCQAELPDSLRYSEQDLQRIESEHQRNQQRRTVSTSYGVGMEFGGGWGDGGGGGGDCG